MHLSVLFPLLVLLLFKECVVPLGHPLVVAEEAAAGELLDTGRGRSEGDVFILLVTEHFQNCVGKEVSREVSE